MELDGRNSFFAENVLVKYFTQDGALAEDQLKLVWYIVISGKVIRIFSKLLFVLNSKIESCP